jgi:hypothetical protein
MELIGKIKSISNTITVNETFRKREVVITTEEQYPQTILIEFTQDKCDILDKYSVTNEVKIGINIRGREWINPEGKSKYFNSIQGWKIELLNSENSQNANTIEVNSPEVVYSKYKNAEENEYSDLPF